MKCVRKAIFFLGLLLVSSASFCSSDDEALKENLRLRRNSMIDFYHIGLNMDLSAGINNTVDPGFFIGIGSFRNLFNADIGVSYSMKNIIPLDSEESVSVHQLKISLSAKVNCIRWRFGSVYLSPGIDWSMPLIAFHRTVASSYGYMDNSIGRCCFSSCLNLGIIWNRLDFSIFCRYDMSPSFNQKYIYESVDYNYHVLYDSIFDRDCFGIGIGYYFYL